MTILNHYLPFPAMISLLVFLLNESFIVTSHCNNRRYKGNNFHKNLRFFKMGIPYNVCYKGNNCPDLAANQVDIHFDLQA